MHFLVAVVGINYRDLQLRFGVASDNEKIQDSLSDEISLRTSTRKKEN